MADPIFDYEPIPGELYLDGEKVTYICNTSKIDKSVNKINYWIDGKGPLTPDTVQFLTTDEAIAEIERHARIILKLSGRI